MREGKDILSLQYGGGAAKGMGTVGGVAGLQLGKRRGMSDICWHPDQVSIGIGSRFDRPKAGQLVTASEDDESPIIMLWDLRNTRAPERVSNMPGGYVDRERYLAVITKVFSRCHGVDRMRISCCHVERITGRFVGTRRRGRSLEK